MSIPHAHLAKSMEAFRILESCIGSKGVSADSSRYAGQCWTRDLALAIAPLLNALGEFGVVRTHLENLVAGQQPNGQIPILFLEDEAAFVAVKEARMRETKRRSFMLSRYLEGQLWNLTPGTKDSEILFIVAMHEYVKASGDWRFLEAHRRHIQAALDYIERELMVDGLAKGCDWRDTMEKQLANETLLTNNALLHRAYKLMGDEDKERALYDRIHEVHFRDGRVLDYPGSDRFDPLGGALSVLCDVAREEDCAQLERHFRSVDSPHGVTIKCRHNPLDDDERAVIERTDGVVVWPFVVGFTSLALRQMGYRSFADEQLAKLSALQGFREWYDPLTGKGYGAQSQLWSATLYLRALLVSLVEKPL